MRTGKSGSRPAALPNTSPDFAERPADAEPDPKCHKSDWGDAEVTTKYRVPMFVLHENLVHFAAFANHVGCYPAPSGIANFNDELTAYTALTV